MIVLLVSALAGLVVGVAVGVFFGPLASILPTLGVLVAVYFLLSRRVSKQLEAGLMQVQKELQKGPKNIENAVRILEGLRARFAKLQFFAGGAIDAQIGTILFMKQDFDKARPYLERAFVRVWHAKAMLAVLEYKKKNMGRVDEIMDKAAKYSGKQGLLWSVWAWLHFKSGNRDRAIEILVRGKGELGDKDPILSSNLLSLQNGKKMKMKGYGDQWYQFHLEQHPQLRQAMRGGNVRFARR